MASVGSEASSFVVVFCTTAPGGAEHIAKILIEERLAACVNIVPIRSCYIWEGEIKLDGEELMIIKTAQCMFETLKKRITDLHGYEVPEIIALPIIDANRPYLDWVSQSVG